MNPIFNQLSQPSSDAEAHSQKLQALISQEIKLAGGKIPFSEFMQLALYAPSLGYYVAGMRKFGEEGDFTTAPEISALFSQCIAQQCVEIFQSLENPSILEFGAGTGIMAADILLQLEESNALPEYYYILEVSPDLQQRQQRTLKQYCPHLFDKIVWLTQLPEEKLIGVILANEVLDAMPVEQFIKTKTGFKQRFVSLKDDEFIFVDDEINDQRLQVALHALDIEFPEAYQSDINLNIKPWLVSLNDYLQHGVILLSDYGYSRNEYYHSQRDQGTLQCYIRHQAHNNPLILIGLQDITAHVDFTAVAQAAIDVGFDVLGFSEQATFLMNNGLLDLVQQDFQQNQQLKKLTLEMGEMFKFIAIGKNFQQVLQGFKQNILYRL